MMIRGKRRVIRLAPHQWVFVAVAFAFAIYGMSPVRVEPSFAPDGTASNTANSTANGAANSSGAVQLAD